MNRKSFITSLLGISLCPIVDAAIVAIPDNLPDDSQVYERVWNSLFTKDTTHGMLTGFISVDGNAPKLITLVIPKELFRECLRKNETMVWIMKDEQLITEDMKYCLPKIFKPSYKRAI